MHALRLSLVCCSLLGVASLLSACAEEEQETVQARQVTEVVAPAEAPDPVAEGRSTIDAFYSALDNAKYERAWSILGPGPRSETDGFASWRDGYATTVSSTPRGLRVETKTPDQVVFSGSLDAEDLDACGEYVTQEFAGTWTVSLSGDPVATDISLEKVAGGTPVLDKALCAPPPAEPGVAPPTDEGCDPNYAGACLDPNSPDYDCEGGSGDGPDYTGAVEVVGDDPYGLDRDGDGYACE